MVYFQCALRILRYIILSLIIQVFAKDDLVLKHHLLASHVFQTIHIDDWLMCVQVCLDEPRCIAYNFKINHGPCELIECGLQDICHSDDSLIYSRGFVFQQLRQGRKDDCNMSSKKTFSDNADRSLQFSRNEAPGRVNILDLTSLEAFTIGFWMKTDDKLNKGTPFSYGTSEQKNELLLYNYQNFQLIIHGERRTSTISATDGSWHHICATWESVTGSWQLLKNGVVVAAGQDLQRGHVIPQGGVLELGQGQDLATGEDADHQSFIGEITSVQLWNFVLSVAEINWLLLSCQIGRGNVLSWSDILNGSFTGAVELVSTSLCN